MYKKLLLAVIIPACFILSGCGGGGDFPPQATTANNYPTQGVQNMPAGFQVFGDHGGVQIDENFYNMTLKQKGTISYPAHAELTPNVWDITVPGVISPILCVRSDKVTTTRYVTKSGDTWTYNGVTTSDVAGSFEYFIFDRMPGSGNGNAGLEVYDANGNITFNSNYTPMKIKALTKLPDSAGMPDRNEVNSYAYPDGRKYAVCLSSPKVTYITVFSDTGFIIQGVYTDGSTYGARFHGGYYVESGNIDAYNRFGGTLLLVDVEGL